MDRESGPFEKTIDEVRSAVLRSVVGDDDLHFTVRKTGLALERDEHQV
jgi:hypothetical protein